MRAWMIIGLVALAILAMAAVAKADNHYCDGDDAQAILDATSSGDTVYFKGSMTHNCGVTPLRIHENLTLIGNDTATVLSSTSPTYGFLWQSCTATATSLNFTSTSSGIAAGEFANITLSFCRVYAPAGNGVLVYGNFTANNTTIEARNSGLAMSRNTVHPSLADCNITVTATSGTGIGGPSQIFNISLERCNISVSTVAGIACYSYQSLYHINNTNISGYIGFQTMTGGSTSYINSSHLTTTSYSVNSLVAGSIYVWNTTYTSLHCDAGTIYLWNTTTVYVPFHPGYPITIASFRTGESIVVATNGTYYASAELMYYLDSTGFQSINYRYILDRPTDWDPNVGTISCYNGTTQIATNDLGNSFYFDGTPKNYTIVNRWVPVPAFTFTDNTPAGQDTVFDASTTSDPDTLPALLLCNWDFGDGNISSDQSIYDAQHHIYTSSGNYTVSLTVRDGITPEKNVSHVAHASGHLPSANIVSNSPVRFGSLMYFGPYGSTYDGSNPTYTWYFPDTDTTIVAPTASHYYASNGTYTVYLYLDDQWAQRGGDLATVTVLEASNVSVFLTVGTNALCWAWDSVAASDFLASYPDIAWISMYNETGSRFQTLYSAGLGADFQLNFSHAYYLGVSANLTIYQPIPSVNATFDIPYGSSFRGDATNKRLTPSDFFNASSDVVWVAIKIGDRFAYYYSWSPEIYTEIINCFEAVYIGAAHDTTINL